MKRTMFLVLLMLFNGYSGVLARQEQAPPEPVLDQSIRVAHVEELEYPGLPWMARIQGIVVIRAKLDKAGKVASSTAVSGNKALIRECLSNSMKWQFQPNSNGEAVIIYDFRLEGECMLPSCRRSFFSFRPPNIAVIIATPPAVNQ